MEAAMAGTDAAALRARAAEAEVEAVAARLGPRFRRRAAHGHAGAYLRGLLGEVERKNGWQLAEHAGHRHPRTMQRVLDRSAWGADEVRDDLRGFVTAELGEPGGVLVVDETGFLKKGTKSCGVARQYSGTAGRIEDCQIGVFLGYAGSRGRAGVERALYLPKEWAQEPERRAEAGVPEAVAFRTKPQLALEMIERALDAGLPARWVVADEVYGSDGKFRRALEAGDQGYVLAVKSNEKPTTWPPYAPPGQVAAAEVAAALEPEAWQRLSCGEGAQGERLYDWACVPLRPALRAGWVHALLVRRHPTEPEEVAYYLVYAPAGTPLAEIVRAAGCRWAIEDVFKLAKRQAGLDHYEVRSWTGWHRHTTPALLALAILAVVAAEKGEPLPTLSSCRSASRSCAAC
jgi:SRSO17 transposase